MKSNKPLLLAGPIIRRVDKKQACIWIATSIAVHSNLEIFRFKRSNSCTDISKDVSENIDKEQGAGLLSQLDMNIVGSGNSTSLKLGDNLYVSLIIARPFHSIDANESNKSTMLPTFPTDEILGYDLELFLPNENKEKGLRLKDLGMLSGENTILYDSSDSEELYNHYENDGKLLHYSFSLPTFYIPVGKNGPKLNILYGSCRKLHGDDEDSLIIGDKVLASSISDLKKRPSSLFLMGDQIYADDVSGPLIRYLEKLSSEILGWREIVDGIDTNLEDIPIGGRKEIVRSKAHFTSEVSDNHLLGFGEFAAMYLVAWNPLIWPREFESYAAKSYQSPGSKKQYEKQVKELEQSRKRIRKIRRLLANIPTYTICDDHEITDDWNIDRKWRDSVRNSVSGSHIITNGLVAYWAFQGWGNDPYSFDADFIITIKKYLDLKKQKSVFHYDKIPENSKLDFGSGSGVKEIEEAHVLEDRIWNYKKWTYVAPTYPLSIFLDCRTQREFVNPDGPPVLLNDEALSHIKSEVYNYGYKRGDPLVIISPTPVFGFELAESVQRFLTSISGTYKWDLETWRANEMGFIKFLSFLANVFSPSYCVILSGDVHYAFTMKAKFELFNTGHHPKRSPIDLGNNHLPQSPLRIAQLTASPLRSNNLTKRKLAIMVLNLIHKIVMTKKMISRSGFLDDTVNNTNQNNCNAPNGLKKDSGTSKKNRLISRLLYKESKNYSKHGKGESLFIKLKTICTSLICRYLIDTQKGAVGRLPDWKEFRMLVKPNGCGTTPILANNNIGLVSLNLESHTVEHTLFFLEKSKERFSKAIIEFDDVKKDIA